MVKGMEKHSGFLRQLKTKKITLEQLVGEIKGIYAALIMAEKKCIEINQQQS